MEKKQDGEDDDQQIFVKKSSIAAKKEASMVTDKMIEELEDKWEGTIKKLDRED